MPEIRRGIISIKVSKPKYPEMLNRAGTEYVQEYVLD